MTLKTLFQDLDEQTSFLEMRYETYIDVSAKYHGTVVKFKELLSILEENERVQSQLLNDKDKELLKISLPIRSAKDSCQNPGEQTLGGKNERSDGVYEKLPAV